MYRKSKRTKEKNRHDPQLCSVCLSSDRILTALGKLKKALQNITVGLGMKMVPTSLLCWECIALLKKVKAFKERAKTSEKILRYLEGSELPTPSLSNLKVVKLVSTNSHDTVQIKPLLLEGEIKTELDDHNDHLQEFEIELNRPDGHNMISEKYETNRIVQNDDTEIAQNDDNIDITDVKSDDFQYPIDKEQNSELNDLKTINNDDPEQNDTELSENDDNIDCTDVQTEYDDDSEYPENNELNASDSNTVNKDENSKPELEKVKKRRKTKKNQEERDPNFEFSSHEKKVIKRKLNENAEMTKKQLMYANRKIKKKYELIKKKRLCTNLRSIVPITRDELMLLREKEKNGEYLKSLDKKCELCLLKIDDSKNRHEERCHQKTKTKIHGCDICQTHMDDEEEMKEHIKKHFFKQQCNLCDFASVALSFRPIYHHLKIMHSKIYRCIECGVEYESKKLFKEHYIKMHTKFQCDYCNKIYSSIRHSSKRQIQRHITIHHMPHTCKICRKEFTTRQRCCSHMMEKHKVQKPELVKLKKRRKINQEERDPDFELSSQKKKGIKRKLNENAEQLMNPNRKIKKYELINNNRSFTNLRSFVPITRDKLMLLREKEKNGEYFKSLHKKCELCLLKMDDSKNRHDEKYHLKTKTKIHGCDICQTYMNDEEEMKEHIKKHFFKQQCNLCEYSSVALSFRPIYHHLSNKHSKIFRCLECGVESESLKVYKQHYIKMHTIFQCDYCNKTYNSKSLMERHISVNHMPHTCKICRKDFNTRQAYLSHMMMKHKVQKSESTYCVTCNIHFINPMAFRRHCKTVAIHKEEAGISDKVQCTECSKWCSNKYALKQHYEYWHLKESKHYCDICDKRFYGKGNLEAHRRSVHQGEKKEKDKICQYCGRGFSVRKTLVHHIRTHTGERPFECSQCGSRFAQKTALKTHIKNIHMKI